MIWCPVQEVRKPLSIFCMFWTSWLSNLEDLNEHKIWTLTLLSSIQVREASLWNQNSAYCLLPHFRWFCLSITSELISWWGSLLLFVQWFSWTSRITQCWACLHSRYRSQRSRSRSPRPKTTLKTASTSFKEEDMLWIVCELCENSQIELVYVSQPTNTWSQAWNRSWLIVQQGERQTDIPMKIPEDVKKFGFCFVGDFLTLTRIKCGRPLWKKVWTQYCQMVFFLVELSDIHFLSVRRMLWT